MLDAIDEDQFLAIVAAGVQAPSAENRHALEFERGPRSITFWATRDHLDAAPHRKILNLIGFGAVAENMSLVARSLGWRPRADVNVAADDHTPLARIDLERSMPETSALTSAIFNRHTNRRFFHGPPLPKEAQDEIESEVAHVPSVILRWFDDRHAKREFANLVRLTETERFRTPSLHEELFAAIRFDVGWDNSAEEGLPPGALGIERPLRSAFSSLRHKGVMRVLTGLGVHHLLGLRAGYLPCLKAPNVVALGYVATGVENGSWLVGRALQRLWLRATVLGLAVQPYAAPGLYALDCYPEVPRALRQHLDAKWRVLFSNGSPLMALRIGRADSPSIRTGRQPARCYLRRTQSS